MRRIGGKRNSGKQPYKEGIMKIPRRVRRIINPKKCEKNAVQYKQEREERSYEFRAEMEIFVFIFPKVL